MRTQLMSGSAFFMPRVPDTQMGFRPSFMPMFEAESGSGGGNEGGNESGNEGGEGGKQNQGNDDGSKKEAAKLARELAGKNKALDTAKQELATIQDQLKKFDGIDPEAVRALLADKAAAEEAKKKAEEDRLKAAGDFEALKARMASQHQKELDNERKAREAAEAQTTALNRRIHELTIGASFQASTFLREETLLPPAKARRAFEDHFEVQEDGQVIGYDRPAGSKDRVPLVDARGRPLPFDEAIKQIVEADPDRDHLLKSKVRPGSGQVPGSGGSQQRQNTNANNEGGEGLKGVAAIAAALKKRNGGR
jgi:hypothetical protein